jgi:hypothetical protein
VDELTAEIGVYQAGRSNLGREFVGVFHPTCLIVKVCAQPPDFSSGRTEIPVVGLELTVGIGIIVTT